MSSSKTTTTTTTSTTTMTATMIEGTEMQDWIAFRTDLFNQLFDDTNGSVLNGKVRRHSFTSLKSVGKRSGDSVNKANDHANRAVTFQPKAKFLVGYNDIEQLLAITLVEESRKVNHNRATSQATSIKITDLIELNSDLSLICKDKVQLHFDPIQKIIWTLSQKQSPFYYFRYWIGWATHIESLEIEKTVQTYLIHVTELCGLKLLKTLLFEKQVFDKCEDNLHELQLKEFEQTANGSRKRLEEIVLQRRKARNLQSVLEIYKREDFAVLELRQALDQWYQFQLVPFIQMREIALEQIDKAEQVLADDNLGERVKHEHRTEHDKFFNDYLTSTEAIHQIYLDYYRENVEVLSAQISRAIADQQRYGGTSAFRLKGCLHRLEELRLRCLEQEIGFLNCRKSILENQNPLGDKEQLLNFAKTAPSQSMEVPRSNNIQELNNAIELIELEMEIMLKKEAILKLRLAKVLEDAKASQADQLVTSVFFDTVETPEEIEEIDRIFEQSNLEVQGKINELKSAIVTSGQRRAKMRTRLAKKVELRKQHQKECEALLQEAKKVTMVPLIARKAAALTKTGTNLSRSKSIDSLASNSSASSFSSRNVVPVATRTGAKPQKSMSQLRRETLNRLKKFEMNKIIESEGAEDQDEEQNEKKVDATSDQQVMDKKVVPKAVPTSTPPSRLSSDPIPSASIQTIVPPPPPPPVSLFESKSSAPPPPPPPPASLFGSPSSVPPPPPPPPSGSILSTTLPSSNPTKSQSASTTETKGFSLQEMLQKRNNLKPNDHANDRATRTNSEMSKPGGGLINLQDIINSKSRLKSTKDKVSKEREKGGDSKERNLMQSMMSQLEKIRPAVGDSDTEDDADEDNDFSD